MSHDITDPLALGLLLSFRDSEKVVRNSATHRRRDTSCVATGNESGGRDGRGGIPCSLHEVGVSSNSGRGGEGEGERTKLRSWEEETVMVKLPLSLQVNVRVNFLLCYFFLSISL